MRLVVRVLTLRFEKKTSAVVNIIISVWSIYVRYYQVKFVNLLLIINWLVFVSPEFLWIIIKLSTGISMHESEVVANDADDDDPDYQPSFDITAVLWAFVFLHYLEQMKFGHQIIVWNILFEEQEFLSQLF